MTQAFDNFENVKVEQLLKLRVKKAYLFKLCLAIDTHPVYQAFISLMIMANFAVLALD